MVVDHGGERISKQNIKKIKAFDHILYLLDYIVLNKRNRDFKVMIVYSSVI